MAVANHQHIYIWDCVFLSIHKFCHCCKS